MTPRIRTVRDETGVALPLALFALVMLSGLLLAFLSMAGMEPVIAQNHASSSKAFYVADAGIEHAVDVLQSPGSPALPQVGKQLNLFSGQVFGGGSYSVTVSQNADGTYLLTSTGTHTNGSRAINVRVNLGDLQPPRGAAEILIGANGSYEGHADPGGSFDGRDWNAPASIAACADIANCGTKISDTGTYGAFANSSSESFDLSGGGTMFGTGCTSGCTSAGSASNDRDSTVPLTRWDNFINAAIPMADRTVTGTVLESPSTTVTWGTRAAPEITVINNSANVSWKTKVNGAGVLIIDSPGPTQNLKFSNGELNWEGLVIIRSPGEVQFEIENAAGRIRVFGQVVNRSAVRAEIELNKPDNFIKYSSAALGLVRQLFFAFRSWQEVVTQ